MKIEPILDIWDRGLAAWTYAATAEEAFERARGGLAELEEIGVHAEARLRHPPNEDGMTGGWSVLLVDPSRVQEIHRSDVRAFMYPGEIERLEILSAYKRRNRMKRKADVLDAALQGEIRGPVELDLLLDEVGRLRSLGRQTLAAALVKLIEGIQGAPT